MEIEQPPAAFADRLKGATRHPLVRLLAALAVVQAAFWLVFNPVFINPPSDPVDFYEVTALEVADLSEPSAAALERASFRPVDQQAGAQIQSGYSAVRAEIELPAVPASGLAMLDQNGGDNSQIYVNGQLLFGEGKMRLPDVSYHAQTKQIIRIPPAMLQSGTNRIDTLRVFDIPRYGNNLPSLFGDYDQVSQAFGWKNFLLGPGRIVSLAIGCVLLLFIAVALVRSDRNPLLVWLFLLTFSWAARTHFYVWDTIPLHGFSRGLYYALITLFLSACWPILVDAWSGRPVRYFKSAMLAIFAVAAAVISYLLLVVQGDIAWDQATTLLDQVGMAFMALMLARMIWHFCVSDDDRHWEGAILITLGLTVAIFLVNIMLWGRNTPYLTMTQPLFLLAFSVAFFSRNFQLFRSTAQINALLQEQLDEKTQALEAAHVREKGLVRQQAHDEERRRLMRDMHDGLGSHLMALLVMSRRGVGKPEDFSEGIQQVIDEMRLMIESLDSVGDSLEFALTSFQKMMSARINAAGFDLDWRDEMAGQKLPDCDARTILQVFRILQEAVTNSLKHSQGDTITVSLRPSDEQDYAAEIEVRDNGKGAPIAPDRPGGHGLRNMRARAASIGAQISIGGDGNGTVVALMLKPDDIPGENVGQGVQPGTSL